MLSDRDGQSGGDQTGGPFEREPEQPKTKSRPWPVIAGLVVLAIATFALSATVFSSLLPSKPAATPTPAGSVAVAATPTTRPATPTATTSAAPSPTAPGGEDAPTETVLANIASLRGLPLQREVPLRYMTRDALGTLLQEEFAEEYAAGEIEQEKAVYVLLDLVEPSLDLEQVLLDMLTEQVMGLYDDEADEMVMIAGAGALSTLEELTLSHEYVHALQDQHFDLTALMTAVEEDGDAAIALQALVEGDATLAMSVYALSHMTGEEIAAMQDEVLGYDQEKLFSAPPVLQAALTFPYQQGATFVGTLYQRGGWRAVNEAYARPPRTTEQVIHPEKYLAGEGALPVSLPDLAAELGQGWQKLDENALGELGWLIYFVGNVENEDALAAAAGWGGDRYALYGDGAGSYALAALTAWDTPADADEFFKIMRQARSTAADATVTVATENHLVWSGPAGHGAARLQGDRVLYVVTPDAATTTRVASRLAGG